MRVKPRDAVLRIADLPNAARNLNGVFLPLWALAVLHWRMPYHDPLAKLIVGDATFDPGIVLHDQTDVV